MTDQELLKLAAKAAGMTVLSSVCRGQEKAQDENFLGLVVQEQSQRFWNPLADDGDALRLAVKLQLTICNEHVQAGVAYCTKDDESFPDVHGAENGENEVVADDYAATRRAIVLAAIEWAVP